MARFGKKRLWGANAGESITIMRPTVTHDENSDEVITYEAESLGNVLFGVPSVDDISEAERLHGMKAAYKLAIPQTYTESLRGCIVVRDWDGTEWKVITDKPPLPVQLTPTAWNREVVVGVEYG